MQIKTGAEFAAQHSVRGDVVLTAAQGVSRAEEIQKGLGVNDRAVGAEIARTVLVQTAGEKNPGKHLGRDADPRVGLGVFQEYVVAGFVLLDEIVLQQQGIGLRIHYRILKISDFADQNAGL